MTTTLETNDQATAPVEPSNPSLTDRLAPAMPTDGRWGWGGPLLVTGIAALIRFKDLGRPDAFVMDETFYAKDAYSLLERGYEQSFEEDADQRILAGDLDVFGADPAFVVHPPFGKWLIAAGEWLLGVDPTGWRVAAALFGTLSVLVLARVVRRMTRSTLLGCVAGLLLALDGLHIALSRAAFLDIFMTLFVLAGFAALVVDRDRVREQMAAWAEGRGVPSYDDLGPHLGLRPWRIAAGVSLGLACGVKWNAIFFVAAFGLMSVWWDRQARRAVGISAPTWGALRLDAIPAFASIVGTALVAYAVTWSSWLATSGGYDRQWASGRDSAFWFVPEPLRALWHHHVHMFNQAKEIDGAHSYSSDPWTWPVMGRPVSMHWDDQVTGCGAERCVSAILGLGNPVIWWAGVPALLVCVWLWLARRDWRAGAALLGFVAGWLPWFLFLDRTTFSWYLVVALPFTIMAITLVLGLVLGRADATPERRTWGAAIVGAYVMVVFAAFVYFQPIWTAETITYDAWLQRMWFTRWI